MTYTKQLDVVEDMVIKREVIAGYDIDAGFFLELPVGLAEPLAFG